GREPARGVALVPEPHVPDFHRRLTWHEDGRLVCYSAAVFRESRVAEAVPHLDGRRIGHGPGSRTPDLPRVVITQVNRLPVGIQHRIVVPRREAILPAVTRPGITGARLRHDASCALVRR